MDLPASAENEIIETEILDIADDAQGVDDGRTTFADLGLASALTKALEEVGYKFPTPIQERAIPVALEGRDLIASANTGTGKTAAFVLPALHRMATTPRPLSAEGLQTFGPRLLVLTPTRELATQVMDAVRGYSKYSRIHTLAILGGMPYRQQLEMLRRRVDLVVATPGRLIDHLERGRLDLSTVEMLVLDEADRMLDMGFLEPVEMIANACPENRQTLLFTATVDKAMVRLAGNLLKNPERVDVAGGSVNVSAIEQRFLRADGLEHKEKLLAHLVADPSMNKGIVFAATKRDADRLADSLSEMGYAAAPLHGDMRQQERNRTVQALRNGRVRLLVATDVAARGIDVPDVTHVINFDLPRQAEDYVHRIGRTGRAGNTGNAFSLYTRHEWGLVRGIEGYTQTRAVEHVIPGLEPREMPKRPAGGPGGAPGGRPRKSFGGHGGGFKQGGFKQGNGFGGGHGGPKPEGFRSEGGYRGEGHRADAPRAERGDRPEGGFKKFGGPRPEGQHRQDRPARAHGAGHGGGNGGGFHPLDGAKPARDGARKHGNGPRPARVQSDGGTGGLRRPRSSAN
ncbi:DEAD/DEAH box helicase [Nitrospirillum sp. BR 11164]|uniref:DEAD/DEAH box helicase n=1 Tax=Nitrospirillum sp. BR 11164 TaxID=3104324 RepID=UPI002AFF4A9E|nr:DEAD/DEAH box helicase [Nitrospirillum sp. BR 11164]MEA1651086.1 DEAD/DEAH box helicase [Nitrospirillum sp. BR 11164]